MAATRFTKADISRAFEGAKSAGAIVSVIEIAHDGTIRLCIAPNIQETKSTERKPKEWPEMCEKTTRG